MIEDNIARWMHEVELTPGSDRQQAIVDAAAAYAPTAKAAELPDMVLLAHAVPADGAFGPLSEAINAKDPTFGSTIDELETHLSAAVFVAKVMSRNNLAATNTAFLVLNAAASGLTPTIADLPGLAEDTRRRRGEFVRSRGAIKSTFDAAGIFDAVPAWNQDGAQVWHQEIRLLREATVGAVDGISKALETLTNRLSTRIGAADEELDLLWWCFSERSDVLNQRWATVTSSGLAAVVAAIEMHRQLKFPAEPQSAAALLARVLGNHAGKPVKLQSAVNDARKAEVTVTMDDGHQLLPVLSSVHEHEALNGNAAWKSSVQERWSIDPGRIWNALDLASECLRELMILESPS